jgi:GNAT superfamily N-acetyltransferase
LTIEPADRFSDAVDVSAVWNRAFATRDDRRFETYFSNSSEVGEILVARLDDGRAVGALGIHARQMQLGRAVWTVGQIGNLGVLPEFRSVGPAVQLVKSALGRFSERNAAVVFGATRLAEAVLQRAGLRVLGDAERWCKPIRTERRMAAGLGLPALANAASVLVDCVLEWRSREHFTSMPAGFYVERIAAFDDRFDRLWNRGRGQFGVTLQRTQCDLSWRFGSCATRQHEILGLLDRSGELRGYLIYRIDGEVLNVMDLFCDAGENIGLLLSSLLRFIRVGEPSVQTVSLECFGSDWLRQRLPAFGFRRRPNRCRVLLADNSGQAELSTEHLVRCRANWFLTGGDADF